MKHRVRVLLSTISAAAMTAIFGAPASAVHAPADVDRPPIERLSSIRKAYLSTLEDAISRMRSRRAAKIRSRNSEISRTFPISPTGEIDDRDGAGRLCRPDAPPHSAVDAILQYRLRVLLFARPR